jgi:hypothetical protein
MGHKLETTAIAYRLAASTVTNVCRRGDRALNEKLHQHTRIECTQLPAVECPQRRQAPRCRHAPPGFEPGTLVQLTGGDLALQRKPSNGGNGLAFADGGLIGGRAIAAANGRRDAHAASGSRRAPLEQPVVERRSSRAEPLAGRRRARRRSVCNSAKP